MLQPRTDAIEKRIAEDNAPALLLVKTVKPYRSSQPFYFNPYRLSRDEKGAEEKACELGQNSHYR
ncbi:MAG TPA: hypothetical protein VE134_03390, partial [Methanomicrobiales archaeon]|nr:hypothetical protein [Methanomicrobiales archaeon]